MNKEDLKIVNRLKIKIKKYPEFIFFVADKRGGNTRGEGKNRSVILARYDLKSDWFQFAKVWGENNRERALEIVELSKSKLLNSN